MRTAKAVGMEMLFEPGHTGVAIKQSQNWKIHVHQYTKFALLVLLSQDNMQKAKICVPAQFAYKQELCGNIAAQPLLLQSAQILFGMLCVQMLANLERDAARDTALQALYCDHPGTMNRV